MTLRQNKVPSIRTEGISWDANIDDKYIKSKHKLDITSIWMNWKLYICGDTCHQRPDCHSKLQRLLKCVKFRGRRQLTPHSEKQRIVRPSGAHSAFTRPSAPESIREFQSSSRSLKTWTEPFLEHAAKRYSESQDHPMCEIQFSDVAVAALRLGALDFDGFEIRLAVGVGDVSTSHVRVIWKVSARRTISLSCTAVRMKCAPGLNDTSPANCLYISVYYSEK
jgi:hypothetical protein